MGQKAEISYIYSISAQPATLCYRVCVQKRAKLGAKESGSVLPKRSQPNNILPFPWSSFISGRISLRCGSNTRVYSPREYIHRGDRSRNKTWNSQGSPVKLERRSKKHRSDQTSENDPSCHFSSQPSNIELDQLLRLCRAHARPLSDEQGCWLIGIMDVRHESIGRRNMTRDHRFIFCFHTLHGFFFKKQTTNSPHQHHKFLLFTMSSENKRLFVNNLSWRTKWWTLKDYMKSMEINLFCRFFFFVGDSSLPIEERHTDRTQTHNFGSVKNHHIQYLLSSTNTWI